VFDHFHVIKPFNEKLSDLRRNLFHQAEDQEKKVLKGIRWLLLKNPENLDRARNEKRRLVAALRLNKPLAAAYYMKEDLRQLWSQATKAQARQLLKDWIARAKASGIKMLKSFAKTLREHQAGNSKAQRPDSHSGRPQPKPGMPGVSHIGKEFERPEWTEAGTLNCLATSMLPHLGQRATSLKPRIRVSKIWSQGAQWYS